MISFFNTISFIYEPIRDFYFGIDEKSYERPLSDLIVFTLRSIFDIFIALVVLYAGYKLAMKMKKARARSQNG